MSVSNLNRRHVRVLREIFKHPIPHDLEWLDVVNLVGQLGSALARHDGKYEFRIGAIRAVFIKPVHKIIETEEVVRLRKFLTQAGLSADGIRNGSGDVAG